MFNTSSFGLARSLGEVSGAIALRRKFGIFHDNSFAA